jgi:hypothetical protein
MTLLEAIERGLEAGLTKDQILHLGKQKTEVS